MCEGRPEHAKSELSMVRVPVFPILSFSWLYKMIYCVFDRQRYLPGGELR